MKNRKIMLLPLLLFVISSCKTVTDSDLVIKKILKEMDAGNLSRVKILADSVRKSYKYDQTLSYKSDSLAQIAERISKDFSLSDEGVKYRIEKHLGAFSDDEKSVWEANGWLEWRLIDGERRYFRRADTNLYILRKFYEQKELYLKGIEEDPHNIFRLKHTEGVIKASGNQHKPGTPVNLRITYTITVHPDVVPDGKEIRCWMPWPRSNHPRQQNIKLLASSEPEYIISPDSAIHSTFYMDKRSKMGMPAVFRISFSYQSNAQHFDLSDIKDLPYDKSSENYMKYTSEQPPQIIFTESIKKLADSLTVPDDSPSVIVRKLYSWFKTYIPWTAALEYSVINNIPEYVIRNKRGDCGMQTLLFISMLRYKGIPVRWQSGWMVPPGDSDMHDWCEVYYEGTGWVPCDISYDLQNSSTMKLREFFISGIDAYRLIVNDGISGPLHPRKQHLRSEPYDFQRGEVEWEGGNLYFDKWDWDMEIDYVQ
jgi:hypothetical protein